MYWCLSETTIYVLSDYHLVVKTADEPFAGTDAQVKVKIHGTAGSIGGSSGREISGSFEIDE